MKIVLLKIAHAIVNPECEVFPILLTISSFMVGVYSEFSVVDSLIYFIQSYRNGCPGQSLIVEWLYERKMNVRSVWG